MGQGRIIAAMLGLAVAVGLVPGTVFGAKIGDCRACHGIVPGVDGKEKNFNPGAHPVHAKLPCAACHREGGGARHIDGIITLRPAIDYSLGSDLSWPSGGGGSCGGKVFSVEAKGCHARPLAICRWEPEGQCRD